MILTTSAWVILFVLLWWLPQNVQHEGMHSLLHKRYGANISGFVPYPTNQDGEFSVKFWEAGFTFASMYYRQPADRLLSPFERAITSIVPQATNTAILVLLLVAYVGVGELPTALVALYITNYLDGMWNIGTFYKPEPEPLFKRSDGWKFQAATGLNRWTCRIAAVVWHVGFAIPFVV